MHTSSLETNSRPVRYAFEVEVASRRLPQLQHGTTEIAKHVWSLRGDRDSAFAEAWGFHVAPGLFLTIAALLDREQQLANALAAKAPSWEFVIGHVMHSEILAEDDLFEIGGSFLNLVEPTKQRCHDAEFKSAGCLRADHANSSRSKDLQLIFANAVFEESSGIHQTVVDGPSTRKELAPEFTRKGLPADHYDHFRREHAQRGAVELFQWSRQQLRPGGFLVTNNLLSPAVTPTTEQLQQIGFSLDAELFKGHVQTPYGAFDASTRVFTC